MDEMEKIEERLENLRFSDTETEKELVLEQLELIQKYLDMKNEDEAVYNKAVTALASRGEYHKDIVNQYIRENESEILIPYMATNLETLDYDNIINNIGIIMDQDDKKSLNELVENSLENLNKEGNQDREAMVEICRMVLENFALAEFRRIAEKYKTTLTDIMKEGDAEWLFDLFATHSVVLDFDINLKYVDRAVSIFDNFSLKSFLLGCLNRILDPQTNDDFNKLTSACTQVLQKLSKNPQELAQFAVDQKEIINRTLLTVEKNQSELFDMLLPCSIAFSLETKIAHIEQVLVHFKEDELWKFSSECLEKTKCNPSITKYGEATIKLLTRLVRDGNYMDSIKLYEWADRHRIWINNYLHFPGDNQCQEAIFLKIAPFPQLLSFDTKLKYHNAGISVPDDLYNLSFLNDCLDEKVIKFSPGFKKKSTAMPVVVSLILDIENIGKMFEVVSKYRRSLNEYLLYNILESTAEEFYSLIALRPDLIDLQVKIAYFKHGHSQNNKNSQVELLNECLDFLIILRDYKEILKLLETINLLFNALQSSNVDVSAARERFVAIAEHNKDSIEKFFKTEVNAPIMHLVLTKHFNLLEFDLTAKYNKIELVEESSLFTFLENCLFTLHENDGKCKKYSYLLAIGMLISTLKVKNEVELRKLLVTRSDWITKILRRNHHATEIFGMVENYSDVVDPEIAVSFLINFSFKNMPIERQAKYLPKCLEHLESLEDRKAVLKYLANVATLISPLHRARALEGSHIDMINKFALNNRGVLNMALRQDTRGIFTTVAKILKPWDLLLDLDNKVKYFSCIKDRITNEECYKLMSELLNKVDTTNDPKDWETNFDALRKLASSQEEKIIRNKDGSVKFGEKHKEVLERVLENDMVKKDDPIFTFLGRITDAMKFEARIKFDDFVANPRSDIQYGNIIADCLLALQENREDRPRIEKIANDVAKIILDKGENFKVDPILKKSKQIINHSLRNFKYQCSYNLFLAFYHYPKIVDHEVCVKQINHFLESEDMEEKWGFVDECLLHYSNNLYDLAKKIRDLEASVSMVENYFFTSTGDIREVSRLKLLSQKYRRYFDNVIETIPNQSKRNAILQETNPKKPLQKAELREPKLQATGIQLAEFGGSEFLQTSEFHDAKLRAAELQKSQLRAAELQEAKIQTTAELRAAELQEAEPQTPPSEISDDDSYEIV